MYKDFVNVTPESGGTGTTPIAVAADENEGAARSTSLNIAGGGVTRTVPITQKKMLVENQIEVKYWIDAATTGAGASIYLEAYANDDVASNLKIDFSIDQMGPTGQWETNTPVEILINAGDNASTTYEVPYYDYSWRFHEDVATITPSQDDDFIYDFVGFTEMYMAPSYGKYRIDTFEAVPHGSSISNTPLAEFRSSSVGERKSVLILNSINLLAFTTDGGWNTNITNIEVSFMDEFGQQPMSIQISGSSAATSTSGILKSGLFQNGRLDNFTVTGTFVIGGVNRQFSFRFNGKYTG